MQATPLQTCAADGCDKPAHRRDLCSMHDGRLRRTGSLADPRRTLVERFESHVIRAPSGCWIWTARLSWDWYGYFGQKVDGRWKNRRAHRVAWEIYVGPIPEGQHLDHLCRRRRCVNPMHLQPVAPQVNTMRGTGPTAANAALERCKRDHPLSGDNLQLINAGGRVKRRCKRCDRDRVLARKGGEGA